MLPYSENILSENTDDAGVHSCFKAISFNRGNRSSCIQAFNGQHFLSTSGSEINFFISFLIKISFDFFFYFSFFGRYRFFRCCIYNLFKTLFTIQVSLLLFQYLLKTLIVVIHLHENLLFLNKLLFFQRIKHHLLTNT